MRIATAARWSGAWWFLPLLFVTTCVLAVGYGSFTGYPTNDLTSVTLAFYVVCPLTAGYVALQFRGFRRASAGLRSNRSGLRLVFTTWWALLLGAPMTVLVAAVVTSRQLPVDRASWTVLAVEGAAVLASGMVGLAASWALPVLVAVPVVAGGLFYWFAYLSATGHPALHAIDSSLDECCAPIHQPAAVAVHASLAVTVTTTVLIALLLGTRRWARLPTVVVGPAAGCALAAAVALGLLVATTSSQRPGLVATEPRTTALDCRSSAGVRTCLWPEETGRRDALIRDVVAMNRLLARWRLDTVTRIDSSARDRSAIPINIRANGGPGQLREALARGYLAGRDGCTDPYGPGYDERVAFLERALDRNGGEVSRRPLQDVGAWLTSRTGTWCYREPDVR